MWSQQIHVEIFAYHLSTSKRKLRNWFSELSNFPTIKESRFILLDSMHQLYFTKKHRRFFPPGQHRKIESTNTMSEKSADWSGKYYEALHTFISKKPALLPCGSGKKRTRSLSEQHSAVSQARHVAQYWNMREVKVCKYHLIAESCSRLVHRVRNRRPFYRGCIEREEKPRLQTVGQFENVRYSGIYRNYI